MNGRYALPCLLFAFSAADAQTYVVTPNDTLNCIAEFNELRIFDIYQENVSGDTLQLDWSAVSVDLPVGWDYSMCDFGHCYPGVPGGSMLPVEPIEEGFLGLNIMPGTTSGTGEVRVYVFDVNAPAQGDTLTWLIRTEDLTGIAETGDVRFTVYPNPASDLLTFNLPEHGTGNHTVTMFDALGRTVLQTALTADYTVLDLGSLSNGSYALQLTRDSSTLATRRLVVQH